MDIPSIKILSPDLTLLDDIDMYTSLQYTRSWQGIGSFELHILGNCEAAEIGNLIMLENDGHRAGMIRAVTKTVDINGTTTTITGQTLDGITAQRVIIPSEKRINGGYFAIPSADSEGNTEAAETIMKTMASACLYNTIDSNRKTPVAMASDKKRGIHTNWLSRYDPLNEVLQSISEYCDCGWEIYIDIKNQRLLFEYLEGVDRSSSQSTNSRVILSRDFESIDSLTYNTDTSNHKNLAYCGGVGEDFDRLVIAVTNDATIPTGLDRFEVFEDCGALEIAETDTALSLKTEGSHKLKDYKLTESLIATISQGGSFKYLEQWDLGDLVTVSDRELGLCQDLRVTEVTENYESDNVSISVTLGTSPERLGRIIRKIKPTIR